MNSVTARKRKVHRFERILFQSGLVFNQTWEDPRVDREALAVCENDTVLTIASAGDHVLNLALAGPKHITAIDLNPAQIYLLQLKIAAIQTLPYAEYWSLFSLGPAPAAPDIYHERLRPELSEETQQYWDSRIGIFRRGLKYAGVFGRSLTILRLYLQAVCGKSVLGSFFQCGTLQEQADLYTGRIQPRCWNPIAKRLAASHWTLLFFGGHPTQIGRLRGLHYLDVLESNISRVLSTIPARSNFFWQYAFLGRYLVPPPFLRKEHFNTLRRHTSHIETRVATLEEHIAHSPKRSISRFHLLDAPDWLSGTGISEWWSMIDRAAATGARVLFRSISPRFQVGNGQLDGWVNRSDKRFQQIERTGVYAQVFLYEKRGA